MYALHHSLTVSTSQDVTIFAVLEASENLDAAHVLKIIEKHDPRVRMPTVSASHQTFPSGSARCSFATSLTKLVHLNLFLSSLTVFRP